MKLDGNGEKSKTVNKARSFIKSINKGCFFAYAAILLLKKLCEHSIEFARASGYTGIQFNIVVSHNEGAVALWEKFGFKIIGTTPKGFRHQRLGLVDSYIMFREL